VDELDRDLARLGDVLKERAGARALLQRQAGVLERDAETHRERAEVLNQVVALLAAAQEVWRGGFEAAVGEHVSRGLSGVFGEPLELVVEMGVQADLPVARFRIRDSTGLETEIMEAEGGGLVNVTSFLLLVLVLLATRPALARLLVLDETLSNLSVDFLPQAAALVRHICEEGKFQLVLVTHREELAEAGDVAYRFSKQDGVTRVRRLRGGAEGCWPNA
jgi:hypothetical protein